MNFSNLWRSLWPIAAISQAPNLLSSDQITSLGPLLFHPSQPHRILLASPSLAIQIPSSSPPSILDDIQSFFRSSAYDSFLSTSDQRNITVDIHSTLSPTASDPLDPLSCNNLHALPCHDGSCLLLFFPTGDNSDEIGFLCLRFRVGSLDPELVVAPGGDIFKQKDGLKHPRHRILKLSVVSSPAGSSSPMGNSFTEGFLMAITLYSVNWFRIERKGSDEGIVRPFLVPLAMQGFSNCLVDACWSPHFPEESAVLLENGELCWFNLVSKKGGAHRVSLNDSVSPGKWLGCRFGGQPWVVLVACSIAVIMIDLRPKKLSEAPRVLARVKLPDFLGVISMEEEKDTFQAICRPDFSDFHFAALTVRLLLLFDIRKPLAPILSWNHGLEHPTHVSMFRLSELRPSEKFKQKSKSGFAILVGSFWKNEFKLFCYGSSGKRPFRGSFYAWDLPSSLYLSGKQLTSGDDFVREMMLKETFPNQAMQLRKEGVRGFYIIPDILLKSRPPPNGFVLIRLMLSGKLEIQEYHSSYDLQNENFLSQGYNLQKAKDFITFNTHEDIRASNRHIFLNLRYLSKYMNGKLSSLLINRYLELKQQAVKHSSFSDDGLRELLSSNLQASSTSIFDFIADVSIPTNVFEVASQRVLTTLQPNILSLAFTKYEELFPGHHETSFLPLEFPNCLSHHKFPHFFVSIPSKRSELLPKDVLSGEAIVGPILPIPVLHVLQQKDFGKTEFFDTAELSNQKELDDDLLTLDSKYILKKLFPEISIADSGGFSEWGASQELKDDGQYFVYKPTFRSYRYFCSDGDSTTPTNEAQSHLDHLFKSDSVSEDTMNDEKFTTFICDNSDKYCHLDCGSQVKNPEFLEVGSMNLDLQPLNILLHPTEQNALMSLKRQASKWLKDNKSFQDFCTSSKALKPIL